MHPLGKSPVITEGDITVAESGAIVEYLLDAHDPKGTLRPKAGTPERMRFTYWLHYAEGSAMTPLLLALLFVEIVDLIFAIDSVPTIFGISASSTSTSRPARACAQKPI